MPDGEVTYRAAYFGGERDWLVGYRNIPDGVTNQYAFTTQDNAKSETDRAWRARRNRGLLFVTWTQSKDGLIDGSIEIHTGENGGWRALTGEDLEPHFDPNTALDNDAWDRINSQEGFADLNKDTLTSRGNGTLAGVYLAAAAASLALGPSGGLLGGYFLHQAIEVLYPESETRSASGLGQKQSPFADATPGEEVVKGNTSELPGETKEALGPEHYDIDGPNRSAAAITGVRQTFEAQRSHSTRCVSLG